MTFSLRRRHREELRASAVQQDFKLVRLAQSLDVFVTVARETNLDFIFAVPWECVWNQRTATRAQRKPLDVFLLRDVRWNAKRVASGRAPWPADGQAADLLGGGAVTIQERRSKVRPTQIVKAQRGG